MTRRTFARDGRQEEKHQSRPRADAAAASPNSLPPSLLLHVPIAGAAGDDGCPRPLTFLAAGAAVLLAFTSLDVARDFFPDGLPRHAEMSLEECCASACRLSGRGPDALYIDPEQEGGVRLDPAAIEAVARGDWCEELRFERMEEVCVIGRRRCPPALLIEALHAAVAKPGVREAYWFWTRPRPRERPRFCVALLTAGGWSSRPARRSILGAWREAGSPYGALDVLVISEGHRLASTVRERGEIIYDAR